MMMWKGRVSWQEGLMWLELPLGLLMVHGVKDLSVINERLSDGKVKN